MVSSLVALQNEIPNISLYLTTADVLKHFTGLIHVHDTVHIFNDVVLENEKPFSLYEIQL